MKKMVLALFLVSANAFAALPEGTYKVDPDHTNIGFEVSHLGISFVVGRFNKLQGEVNLVPNGDSRVNIEVDVASIDTKVAQRDQHLRSADFFNTSQFPKAKFESTRVEYTGDGQPSLIHGNLTLHGVTGPVTLTVTPVGSGNGPVGDFRAGFKATTTIKRSEFGMRNLLAVAGDQVTLTVNVEGIKQ